MTASVLLLTDRHMNVVKRPDQALLCFAHMGMKGKRHAVRVMVKGEGDAFEPHEDDRQFLIKGDMPTPESLIDCYKRKRHGDAEKAPKVCGSSDGDALLLTTTDRLDKVRRDSKQAALRFMRVGEVESGMQVRAVTRGSDGKWIERPDDVQFNLYGATCTDQRLLDHYRRTVTGDWKGWSAPPRKRDS